MDKPESAFDHSLKLMVKSSMIVLFGIFISKILIYVYRIIIARFLGSELYGVFSLGVMILGLFVAFFSFGLNEGILRYFSLYRGSKKNHSKIKYLYRRIIKILIFSGVIGGGLLFFFAEQISINLFHNNDLGPLLKFFGILLPFFVLGTFFLNVLRAFEKIGMHSFINNIFQNIMKVLVLVFLLIIGFKLEAIAFSYIIAIFAIFLFASLICKYRIPLLHGKSRLSKKVKKDIDLSVFKYSLPLLFFGVLLSLFYWLDSFVIGFLMTVKDVGIYNAAVPIGMLLAAVPEIFMQLFFPLITKEYSKNDNLVKKLSKQVGKWIFLINFPAVILIITFPQIFINFLFGAEYLVAANALRFLAIGMFIYSLFIVCHNLLFMIGKSKLILFDMGVASIISLILNFILIPKYGITGAAISTMIAILVMNLLFFFQTRYYLSIIPFKRKMLRIILITFVPVFILILIKNYFTITSIWEALVFAIFFILSYFLLILVTKCLDDNDFMILKAIKRKLKKN